MPRKATSQDVADLAGVSRSAVSLVLNGRGAGNIAVGKQALIIEAARALNYTPNAVALSLRSRRSLTIGVVTDAVAPSDLDGRLLQGAVDAAAAEGYLLLVIDTQRDAERERQAYDTLQNRQVDGFVFAAVSLRPYEPPPLLRGVPSALANCSDSSGQVAAFVPDEVAGSRAITRLLVEQGHRDIVMITGSADVPATGLREQGFADALTSAGLAVPAPVPGGGEIDSGYAAAMHALTSTEARPTALFCVSDRVAVGAVLAATRLGLSVPGEVSVVGYDEEDVAAHLVPPLTTVRLPHREMGEQAVRVVLDAVLDASEPVALGSDRRMSDPTLLPCSLVIRDSVAPPRS